ncbi:MAG: aminopeptidase P family protein [Actinobacteria bacterium]|nr:aminopeptidase P family protein [Actinomycetota bacterium]
MRYEARIERVRAGLEDAGVDALLVTDLTNVRYLTGFSGTNGQALVTNENAMFMSDPRYAARARALVEGVAEVVIYSGKLTDVLGDKLGGVRRLGFESQDVSVATHAALGRRLEDVELIATTALIEGLRRVKEPEEVELLREAIRLGDNTFEWVLDRIAPGVTERALALDLEVHMRSLGADGISFDPIVASGPLSAHIHHTPSDRAFERGDFVLMDFGCKSDGYCSDLSRTVVVGPASEEQTVIYDLVLAAHHAGIDAVSAGAQTAEVDKAARSIIDVAGHADHFGHPLGHGVGLDIHEAPRVGSSSEEDLEAPELIAGDVVTIEPGVYVDSFGGVRIEDCVLVTDEGSETLGSAHKDKLLEL